MYRSCECGREYVGDHDLCDVCRAQREDWRYERWYEALRKRAAKPRYKRKPKAAAVALPDIEIDDPALLAMLREYHGE